MLKPEAVEACLSSARLCIHREQSLRDFGHGCAGRRQGRSRQGHCYVHGGSPVCVKELPLHLRS